MKPPIFIELCAGTAALSLRLQGGRACRPIVSRIGAKTGYADVILPCFGLTAGQRAGAYLWCEPDPGARLLLQALGQPEVLHAAAEVLRGWASEEPRALWDRLRAEGPPRGLDGREVARWAVSAAWSFRAGFPELGWHNPTDRLTVGGMVSRLVNLPELSAIVCDDARTVDPREVARWCVLADQAYRKGDPASGFNDDLASWAHGGRNMPLHVGVRCSERIATMPAWPPVTILDAATDPGPGLPAGTVCYIDPPYEATTGYGHDLPRSEVVRLALLWAQAGAFVGVSEQCPIPELVSAGWHAVEITHGRRGQKRTFSKQQREYLTLSRPPVHPPLLGVQEVLL